MIGGAQWHRLLGHLAGLSGCAPHADCVHPPVVVEPGWLLVCQWEALTPRPIVFEEWLTPPWRLCCAEAGLTLAGTLEPRSVHPLSISHGGGLGGTWVLSEAVHYVRWLCTSQEVQVEVSHSLCPAQGHLA